MWGYVTESGDDGEVGLYVGVKVGSRDFRNFSKYIKGGINVRIYENVGWVVNIGVGAESCIGVDGKLYMSNFKYVWRMTEVYIKVLAEVLVLGLLEELVFK